MKTLFTSLVVAASLCACVQSALNPTDKVKLTGTVLEENKAPYASAELDLSRSDGSACLITQPFAKLQTTAEGTFSKDLTGADTQSGDIARCFRVTVPPSGKGALVYAHFLMQVTEVKVPAIQRW